MRVARIGRVENVMRPCVEAMALRRVLIAQTGAGAS
jgi:hypothetical protein